MEPSSSQSQAEHNVNKAQSGMRKMIEKAGQQIIDLYCQNRGETMSPVMIPPIPDSKFIDKLPEDVELEGQNADEKNLQDGYIAEVKVFRRFEDVEKDIIVLHQLDYTHEQYSVFLPNHHCNTKRCKREPPVHDCHQPKKNIDGEQDFIVISRNFAAVFEVKGLSFSGPVDMDRMKSCFTDATRQIKRVTELIKAIDPLFMVYEFTVFSNISRAEVDEGHDLSDDSSLLFSEDLDDLNWMMDWLETNPPVILSPSKLVRSREAIKRCLLGLWCVNSENKWDHTLCSLSKCILDINSKLRQAVLTRRLVDEVTAEQTKSSGKNKKKKVVQTKNKTYPHNPDMVAAPELFQKYLNVKSLTHDQLDVFNSDEQFLWVEGPAGSGKTIAMLGKILQLTLNSEKRCLLLIAGGRNNPAAQRHEKLFNDIQQHLCQVIVYRQYSDLELNEACDLLEAQLNSSICKIVILVMFDTLLSENISSLFKLFDYLFVDDIQLLVDSIRYDSNNEPSCAHIITDGLLPVVQSAVTNNNTAVWVLCDEGQSWWDKYYRLFNEEPAVTTVLDQFRECFRNSKDLSVNLRNTFEISSVLSVIRGINNEMDYAGTRPGHLPPQKSGHFLRGTKPVIYLLRDDKPGSWSEIVKRELEKLTGPDSCLDNKDIAVLHNLVDDHDHMEQLRATVESVVQERRAGTQEKIAVRHVLDCMSAEWPAVIFICRYLSDSRTVTLADNSEKEITYSNTIPLLYTGLSRARVHCAVIVYDYKENTADEYTDKLFTELKQRQDVCRFIDIPADTDNDSFSVSDDDLDY